MSADLLLPPGFRFHPTDEELVMHYLCKKCSSQAISIPIIKEIDLYKYDPWQLPDMALYGEKEWYFFSPRDRKYPNGSRPNRAAGTGYWKATGADKPIGKTKKVGIKKALVFYAGKAPKGVKTNWIMHEYRLADVDRSVRKKNNSLRLDDWVLCRIYNKKGAGDICRSSTKPETTLTVSGHPPVTSESARELVALGTDFVSSDRSDSVAYAPTDSNCSDRVISSNVTCDREVESHRTWSWEIKPTLDIPLNISNATGEDGFYQGFDSSSLSPGFKEILDIFKYI